MSDICVSWQHNRYCYAHEQCRLATRQWSRLLDSMLSVGLVKASPLCGPSIDPCLTRLVNSADYESVISRESRSTDDSTGSRDCELAPGKRCCSDGERGTRHGLRRNGLTPWKSDVRIYSTGVKGYVVIVVIVIVVQSCFVLIAGTHVVYGSNPLRKHVTKYEP